MTERPPTTTVTLDVAESTLVDTVRHAPAPLASVLFSACREGTAVRVGLGYRVTLALPVGRARELSALWTRWVAEGPPGEQQPHRVRRALEAVNSALEALS